MRLIIIVLVIWIIYHSIIRVMEVKNEEVKPDTLSSEDIEYLNSN